MLITSLQNPRIREIVRLRQGRKRRQTGKVLIDGQREVCRALRSGFPVREIYACPELMSDEAHAWMAKLPDLFEVTPDVFRKIAYGEREDGVLAVADSQEKTLDEVLDELPTDRPPLLGVLEGVEKPGNIGAILRSADGAGFSALIVADPKTDLFNPNTIRASLGTIFSVPVCTASAMEVRHALRQRGITMYAAIVDGAEHYTHADFTGPSAVILGSEAWGLTEAFRGEGIHPIFLPMLGIADSLNVSTTAAILFYEALRQRNGDSTQ
ncbi:MAG: RNA methyltransferase [Planctomycetia bacterium]|nr:RNA methyltransferase [Planctomycetia bacterium]